MSNWYFVIAAYVLTWTVLVVYTTYLFRRRRSAERRLAEAESKTGGTT